MYVCMYVSLSLSLSLCVCVCVCVQGIPVIEAPTEAEAQCAAMAKAGLVFATGSEDMDALTFSTPILLRHLNYAEAQKKPILEIHLDKGNTPFLHNHHHIYSKPVFRTEFIHFDFCMVNIFPFDLLLVLRK